jgi:anti-sigma factor RsiW
MSCESYDWKAYALGELDGSARREAESHAATCAGCREELALTRLTIDSLSTLREEELPRRIAFVSDKVFEPRWWQRIFNPNFAAACVIAGAILVHAFAHPAASFSPGNQALIQSQIDAAVNKAVAEVEARHAEQTERILSAYDNRFTQMYRTTTGLVRQ